MGESGRHNRDIFSRLETVMPLTGDLLGGDGGRRVFRPPCFKGFTSGYSGFDQDRGST